MTCCQVGLVGLGAGGGAGPGGGPQRPPRVRWSISAGPPQSMVPVPQAQPLRTKVCMATADRVGRRQRGDAQQTRHIGGVRG